MSESCSHNCSSCSQNCSSRDKKSLIEKTNEMSNVKKVIAIVSGKGGVGKSLVTGLMAVLSQRKGFCLSFSLLLHLASYQNCLCLRYHFFSKEVRLTPSYISQS